jgi:hypothetical protein
VRNTLVHLRVLCLTRLTHHAHTQLVCKGKGWALGSGISSGTVTLTFQVLQEDKGDECTCLGVCLVPDPPATAEYRTSGSPFISLRLFSGEVYRCAVMAAAPCSHAYT